MQEEEKKKKLEEIKKKLENVKRRIRELGGYVVASALDLNYVYRKLWEIREELNKLNPDPEAEELLKEVNKLMKEVARSRTTEVPVDEVLEVLRISKEVSGVKRLI